MMNRFLNLDFLYTSVAVKPGFKWSVAGELPSHSKGTTSITATARATD